MWIKRKFSKDPEALKAFSNKVNKERQDKTIENQNNTIRRGTNNESKGNARNRRLEHKMSEPLQKFYNDNIKMQKNSSPYPFWNIVRNSMKELENEENKTHLNLRPIHFVILQYRLEQHYIPKLMQTIYSIMCATKKTSLTEDLIHLVYNLLFEDGDIKNLVKIGCGQRNFCST